LAEITMVERIVKGNHIFALIVRANYKKNGIEFFTPGSFSQQLGYMKRKKGYVIEPHVHNPVERNIIWTQEVLFIKSGRLRVDFYFNDQSYFKSSELSKGDVILLADGGHGFEMLEECEIIEVKQGPYCGDQDKTRFNPISSKGIKFSK